MNIEEFNCFIKGKSVALVGAGISNISSLDFFLCRGARLTVRDKNEHLEEATLSLLREKNIPTVLGEGYLDALSEDIILRSPGIRPDLPEFAAACGKGALLTSEMEIFLSLCPAKKYAVTGSDGKTTTTTLIAKLLEEEKNRVGAPGKVYLGGNIGTPLLPFLDKMSENDAAVVELSSFQLFDMSAHIDSAVITNITPNHLNWHTDMNEYIAAKAKIFEGQNASERLVLNFENDITRSFANEAKSEVTLFSSKRELSGRAAYLCEDDIIYSDGERKTRIMSRADIKIPGLHNVENYLAAISAVWGEVSAESIINVAKNFGGVEHRIELVGELGGVKYYNSSIDTSPTRTAAALNSFSEKLIVIVGGYDKKIPLEPLAPLLSDRAKFIVCTGATGEKIKAIMEDFGYPRENIVYHSGFDDAVSAAAARAVRGDTVILSPACASFDAFKNFAARGDRFKEIVHAMK